MRIRFTIASLLLCLSACGGAAEPEGPDEADPPATAEAEAADSVGGGALDALDEDPSSGDVLPMPFRAIWAPWHGDFDAMVERRIIRAVVPFGGYQFYYQDGLPRGASWDLLQRLLDVLASIATKHVAGIDAIAAKWVLEQPTVAAIILGIGSRSRAESNLAMANLALDDEDRLRIADCLANQAIPKGEPYDLERDVSSAHSGIIRTNLQEGSNA